MAKKRSAARSRTTARKTSKTPARRSKKSSPAPAAVPARVTGLSLHLGLNTVDPAHYSGWSGPLAACEFDAKDMNAIALAKGMQPTVLLTRDATRAKVLATIRAAAKKLTAGDFFFLSYSGHGGQVADVSGEEIDKQDETWCLFDGQLIDDELYLELSRFAEGVRILVLSDSCHSGTVTRAVPPPPPPNTRSKLMPPDVAAQVYADHKSFYDGLQKRVQKAAKAGAFTDPDAALAQVAVSGRLTDISVQCKAAVLLISGCQDNQTSLDGAKNGAFTEQLLKTWRNGAFTGNYSQFHAAIKAGLPPSQTPNLFQLGPAAILARQRPFTV